MIKRKIKINTLPNDGVLRNTHAGRVGEHTRLACPLWRLAGGIFSRRRFNDTARPLVTRSSGLCDCTNSQHFTVLRFFPMEPRF